MGNTIPLSTFSGLLSTMSENVNIISTMSDNRIRRDVKTFNQNQEKIYYYKNNLYICKIFQD